MSVSRVCGRCAHLCRAACPRSPTTLPPACRRTIGLLPPLPPSFRHLGHAPAVGLWTSDILPSFTCRAVAPFAAVFSPPSPCPCRGAVISRAPSGCRLAFARAAFPVALPFVLPFTLAVFSGTAPGRAQAVPRCRFLRKNALRLPPYSLFCYICNLNPNADSAYDTSRRYRHRIGLYSRTFCRRLALWPTCR